MPTLTDTMRDLLEKGPFESAYCLLATSNKDGMPDIGPKASMMVLDSKRLAYWERSKRTALKNLLENPKVCVYFRNSKRKDDLPRGAALRFYGTAELHEDGELREQVMARTPQQELDADPDRTGIAVVINVELITDLGGNPQ